MSATQHSSPLAIFLIFLRLGLTSFGGPMAHIGYFRQAFVEKHKWFSHQEYGDLVALCQFLPGPASSQVGLSLGMLRGGHGGALCAWLGFTLPSAIILILCAMGIQVFNEVLPTGMLQGLKIIAVAVVAQAVWTMAKTLCPDWPRILIMLAAATATILIPFTWTSVLLITAAGLVAAFKPSCANAKPAAGAPPFQYRHILWLAIFILLLLMLPLTVFLLPKVEALAVFDSFYRSGALVFGGGHVVLPLLQAEVVPNGWVDHDVFVAGYAAAQAVPGPLFTFAAFLGAAMGEGQNVIIYGALALLAIFLPSYFLVAGTLPFWQQLRKQPRLQSSLAAINAVVVGLLLAAFFTPVATSAIHSLQDILLAAFTYILLNQLKLPAWLMVSGWVALSLLIQLMR